jgi:hypothetical protein
MRGSGCVDKERGRAGRPVIVHSRAAQRFRPANPPRTRKEKTRPQQPAAALMAPGFPDRGRSSERGDHRSHCAEGRPTADHSRDSPTKSAWHLRGSGRIHDVGDARATRGASRREAHFLKRPLASRQRIGSVHLQRLAQGGSEVLNQFFPSLPLGIDPGHLLDPPDPPGPTLLDNRGIARSHETPPLRVGFSTC